MTELLLKTIDGFIISAVHTVAGNSGVVLWLHGITVDKDEYLGFFRDGAHYLAARGIDSIRIDFRGHGQSSGTSLDFTIVGQTMDADAAIAFLLRYYEGRDQKIHVVGCSFGAMPAIYVAERYSHVVGSLTLIAPVLSYQRTFLDADTDWGRSIFNKRTLASMDITKQLFIQEEFPISVRLVQEMRIVRPDESLKRLNSSIVLIHGAKDSMVPHEVSKAIADDTMLMAPGLPVRCAAYRLPCCSLGATSANIEHMRSQADRADSHSGTERGDHAVAPSS